MPDATDYIALYLRDLVDDEQEVDVFYGEAEALSSVCNVIGERNMDE